MNYFINAPLVLSAYNYFLPMEEIANGLNIEGLDPYLLLNANGRKKIWGNYIVVLDRPLIDNIVFDDLVKNNKFPMLENAIEDLNENNFLVLFLSTLCYYIHNAIQFTSIFDRKINITIHFHQDITCRPLIVIFHNLLEIYIKTIGISDMNNINVNYLTDFPSYASTHPHFVEQYPLSEDDIQSRLVDRTKCYDNTDILLSFSQCAGLKTEEKPGDIYIPTSFAPFDISQNTVYNSREITIHNENDFVKEIENILKSSFFSDSLKIVNDHYVSFNPKKIQKCSGITMGKNLKFGKILQVNGLWNPTNNDKLMIK